MVLQADPVLHRSSFDHMLADLTHLQVLPDWLLAPLQPDRVTASLQQSVPEFASGALKIIKVKAKRLFLQDESGTWEGTYTLTTRPSSSEVDQVYLLHGQVRAPDSINPPPGGAQNLPFGAAGWQCFLPDLNLTLTMEAPEYELASLPQLTDPEEARILLEEILRSIRDLPSSFRVQSCTPTILVYRAGSRAVIRYNLVYKNAPEDLPLSVIGKIYRRTEKAKNAYEGMACLWETPLSTGEVVSIAEPLAYLPASKSMFQTSIPGDTTLEELFKLSINSSDPDLRQNLNSLMRKTAAGLAAFHASGAMYGKVIKLDDRFIEIRSLLARLAVPFPGLQDFVLPLLSHLETFAEKIPAGPLVPTHGAFSPEQVLIDGGKIGFIDFDDYCEAEPAFDVGLFRAAIFDTGMNNLEEPLHEHREAHLALLDEISDVFLEAYQAHLPVSDERVALWEAVDYLRNCLHFWIKVKPAESDIALSTLDRHLRTKLAMI